MADFKIIGIGGTDGSGKDSLGLMLTERHGWMFISVTDILREEASKRGIPLKRNTLREISSEWRREYGNGVLVDKAVENFKTRSNEYKGLVMASIRNPGEADRILDLGGKVVWVDAEPKIRFERIASRKRGSEDDVTLEEFLSEEKAQLSHSGDSATLSLSGVKVKADIFLENNGNDIEKFKDEAEKALRKLL
jgi:dephospho-CoA kinase